MQLKRPNLSIANGVDFRTQERLHLPPLPLSEESLLGNTRKVCSPATSIHGELIKELADCEFSPQALAQFTFNKRRDNQHCV